MKRLLVILSIILFIVTSMAAFRDIPKGHWAESYVSRLEQIGIVTGFPDGTFRGDEAVTRYQSALLISRTLDYVELVLKDKQAQIDSLLQIVKALQNSFEASNSELASYVENMASQLDELETRLLNIESTIETGLPAIRDMVYGLSEDLANAQEAMKSYTDVIADELRSSVDEISTDVQDIKLTLELHDQDIVKLYDLVTQIQDKFVYTDEEGTTSEIDLSQLKDDVAGLSEILSGLAAQLGDVDYLLRKQISDLDKKASTKDAELETLIQELSTKFDEHEAANSAKFEDVYATIEQQTATLSDAIMGQQEELAQLQEKLDKLSDFVVNFKNEVSEKLENLDMRLGLLEDQVASLTQIVEEVKADKADVEEINKKLSDVEKASVTKKELEEARTIATWGIVTGVSGIVIGIIALGKVLGWF